MTLLERRAEFVYNAARLAAIAAHAPIVPIQWIGREQAFRVATSDLIPQKNYTEAGCRRTSKWAGCMAKSTTEKTKSTQI